MLYGISLACHMTPLDTEALISRFKRWNLDDQIFVACCDQNNRVCHSVSQSVFHTHTTQNPSIRSDEGLMGERQF